MTLTSGLVSRSEFELLKATTEMLKDNVEKNIDWFYSVFGLIIAATGVSLYFLVKHLVKAGIDKGTQESKQTIKDNLEQSKQSLKESLEETKRTIEEKIIAHQPFGYVKGKDRIYGGKFRLNGYGLADFTTDNLINLSISNDEGRLLYTAEALSKIDEKIIEVDFSGYSDGYPINFVVVWIRNHEQEIPINELTKETIENQKI